MTHRIQLATILLSMWFLGCSDDDQNLGGVSRTIDGHVRWYGSAKPISGVDVVANTPGMMGTYIIYAEAITDDQGYYTMTFDDYASSFKVNVVSMSQNPVVQTQIDGKVKTASLKNQTERATVDFYMQAYANVEVNLDPKNQSEFGLGALRTSVDSFFFYQKDSYPPLFLRLKAEMEDSVVLTLYKGTRVIKSKKDLVSLKHQGLGQVRFDL